MDAKKIIREHHIKMGKKGGAKVKKRGKPYFSAIGKLGAKKRWGQI